VSRQGEERRASSCGEENGSGREAAASTGWAGNPSMFEKKKKKKKKNKRSERELVERIRKAPAGIRALLMMERKSLAVVEKRKIVLSEEGICAIVRYSKEREKRPPSEKERRPWRSSFLEAEFGDVSKRKIDPRTVYGGGWRVSLSGVGITSGKRIMGKMLGKKRGNVAAV